MDERSISTLVAAVVVAFLCGAGAFWALQAARSVDADAGGSSDVQSQMMRRKSDALQAVMDEVLAGRLHRVPARVDRLDAYSGVISGFLDTEMYAEQGGAYARALVGLRRAASDEDWTAARDAVLALEQACLDCHRLLHAPEGAAPGPPGR